MKAIILAAGFSTRLYPLTKTKAKPLLEINNKPILDYILYKISELDEITEIFVITNNKFYQDFLIWKNKHLDYNIKILNDNVNNEDESLGSIGDLIYVLNSEEINEDLLVLCGDSLFKFSLKEPYKIFKKKGLDLTTFYDVLDKNKAKRFGVAELDNNNIISNFVEKPFSPNSTLCSTSVYFFKKQTLGLIKKLIKKQDFDNIGKIIEILYSKVKIYGYVSKKLWIDVGTFESYEQAKKDF